MKKAILLILILLISGCVKGKTCKSNWDCEEGICITDDLFNRGTCQKSPFNYYEINETNKTKDNYWEEVNASCVFDLCNKRCNIKLIYNITDWDYNENGKIDELEWEIMQQAEDRDRKCYHECGDRWPYIEECFIR